MVCATPVPADAMHQVQRVPALQDETVDEILRSRYGQDHLPADPLEIDFAGVLAYGSPRSMRTADDDFQDEAAHA